MDQPELQQKGKGTVGADYLAAYKQAVLFALHELNLLNGAQLKNCLRRVERGTCLQNNGIPGIAPGRKQRL